MLPDHNLKVSSYIYIVFVRIIAALVIGIVVFLLLAVALGIVGLGGNNTATVFIGGTAVLLACLTLAVYPSYYTYDYVCKQCKTGDM